MMDWIQIDLYYLLKAHFSLVESTSANLQVIE